MAQIIVDTDYYSIEEIAEEIILRQDTTGMPWKMAITSVLQSYVVEPYARQEVKREQSEPEPKPAKRRGRPRKNPAPAHADIPGAARS